LTYKCHHITSLRIARNILLLLQLIKQTRVLKYAFTLPHNIKNSSSVAASVTESNAAKSHIPHSHRQIEIMRQPLWKKILWKNYNEYEETGVKSKKHNFQIHITTLTPQTHTYKIHSQPTAQTQDGFLENK